MPPLEIEFSSRFRGQARGLPLSQRELLAQAMETWREIMGKPHVHSGLGIRRLRQNYFELRAGRDLRVVFKLEANIASMVLAGNHDTIHSFLKNL